MAVFFTILILGAAVLTIVGFWIEFLRFDFIYDPVRIVRLTVILFLFPALSEELVFRYIPFLLTGSDLTTHNLLTWLVTIVLFVIYHPVNAHFFFKAGRGTYENPYFLVWTFLLGVGCFGLLFTTNLVWPAVALHFVIVYVWIVFLGGHRRP